MQGSTASQHKVCIGSGKNTAARRTVQGLPTSLHKSVTASKNPVHHTVTWHTGSVSQASVGCGRRGRGQRQGRLMFLLDAMPTDVSGQSVIPVRCCTPTSPHECRTLSACLRTPNAKDALHLGRGRPRPAAHQWEAGPNPSIRCWLPRRGPLSDPHPPIRITSSVNTTL